MTGPEKSPGFDANSPGSDANSRSLRSELGSDPFEVPSAPASDPFAESDAFDDLDLPPGELDLSGEADEPEFSLDQIGAAYARVLRGDASSAEPLTVGAEAVGDTAEAAAAGDAESSGLDESADDDAGCPISEESVLEAVLFVGAPEGVKLTSRRLASLMRDVSPKEIKAIVGRLNARYQAENAAYRIALHEEAWRLELIPELKSLEAGFQGEVRPVRLGQSAIDVLAIVAYHQPVSRHEVDRIWQRPCGAILSQLLQRQLIALDSSSGPLRDRKFTTTDRFLGMIGLDSIGDLPQTAEITDMEGILEG